MIHFDFIPCSILCDILFSSIFLRERRGRMGRGKTVVVGAGPVGALAALYAANRGDDIEVYELRSGMLYLPRFYSSD